MAGVAILLDLWRKNTGISTRTIHSGYLTATVAASAAAASVAAGRPFASRCLFGDGGLSVAFADAGATEWTEDYLSNLKSAAENLFQRDSLKYSTKIYPLELKPLFSAFAPRSFAMTSLRSFLMFYLPLLEPRANQEDDDDILQDAPDENPVDLVVPFKKTVKQIIRETTVVTTRRILERIAVHYVSDRMAWKLLKGTIFELLNSKQYLAGRLEAHKSARRKATRGLPTVVYCGCVTRTTFRGHLLGAAATWLVQVGIAIYRYFSYPIKNEEDVDRVDQTERIRILARRVTGATVRCGAALVFASIGGGIGATLIHPSIGQWMGCAVGDLAGPIIVTVFLDKFLHLDFKEELP